jgi:hypothetical protein
VVKYRYANGEFTEQREWDRSSDKPVLWGVVKNKSVSQTLIPAKEAGS